jgi:UDP-N-acetylmuramoyl-L-alanyl-D-glutamate--2,6-diaminopimelate ligase
MAEAAVRCADAVIVTDDNPRSEDPASIRREIMQGAPDAREIGNRAEAIGQAVGALAAGDALVIAGKGHEDYQIIGSDVHHFSDRAEAVKAARSAGGMAIGEPA